MSGGGGIILSKSYALYETKKEYNVIKGTVPDFGYDVKLAVTVDGVKKDTIPSTPLGQGGKYYDVKVSCGSSKTEGLWDYNAWRLNLDYIESNSKCNLTFTSSMSKDQYDEYIKSGVALRRNTYRGKDITDLWKNGDLYKQIEDGTFDDIYVGDYIKGSNEVIWLIADLDNYWNQGDYGVFNHHATIIPSYKLDENRMNEIDTTEGGYVGSEMYKTTLNTIYDKYIVPDFCKDDSECHIIEYRSLESNTVINGISSDWKWEYRKLDLMSEMNVYGGTIWSSSGYDIGVDNRQYAIFQLRPELINQDLSGNRYWYWLKAVLNSKTFANVYSDGVAGGARYLASQAGGVRPRFLID